MKDLFFSKGWQLVDIAGAAVLGPESVSALEASDAGQRSIEHLTGLWISCSGNEEALRKETTAALRSGRR